MARTVLRFAMAMVEKTDAWPLGFARIFFHVSFYGWTY